MQNLTTNATLSRTLPRVDADYVKSFDQITTNFGVIMCFVIFTVAVLVTITVFYSNRLVERRETLLNRLEEIVSKKIPASPAKSSQEGYSACPMDNQRDIAGRPVT